MRKYMIGRNQVLLKVTVLKETPKFIYVRSKYYMGDRRIAKNLRSFYDTFAEAKQQLIFKKQNAIRQAQINLDNAFEELAKTRDITEQDVEK